MCLNKLSQRVTTAWPVLDEGLTVPVPEADGDIAWQIHGEHTQHLNVHHQPIAEVHPLGVVLQQETALQHSKLVTGF